MYKYQSLNSMHVVSGVYMLLVVLILHVSMAHTAVLEYGIFTLAS